MTGTGDEPLGGLLRFAEALAQEAGAAVRSSELDRTEAQTKAGAADWVTPVDRAVELRIRGALAARYPGHAVLGEETGASGASEPDGLTWHVDPIDGTTNFLHDAGNVTVSIALVDADGPLLGVVYDVYRRQTVSAARGLGVRLDGVPVPRWDHDTLSGRVVLTEWSGHRAWPGMPEFLHWVTGEGAAVRIIGSCALALAHAGLGRSAVTILPGHYNSWDVAAGVLIAAESGLAVRGYDGEADPLPLGGLVVAPPALVDKVWSAWRGSAGGSP